LPADLEVVVASYEEGYDLVTDLREIAIDTAAAKDWYKISDHSIEPDKT